MVHWILTLKNRDTGWLNATFHNRFREILLHTAIRYQLVCPVYCLMHDHLHQIWLGISTQADQLKAMRFFRRYLQSAIKPHRFQKQAYDNVLREEDRERDAFRATQFYILENPVRARLVQERADWPYAGCMLPGYPDLHPLNKDFDRIFWDQYAAAAAANAKMEYGQSP